jgi:hypothetical protein
MQKENLVTVIKHLKKQKVKIKLLSATDKEFSVEFSGKDVNEMRKQLERHLAAMLHVAEEKKTKTKSVVKFIIKKESPADHILEILKKYDEGATPRKENFED